MPLRKFVFAPSVEHALGHGGRVLAWRHDVLTSGLIRIDIYLPGPSPVSILECIWGGKSALYSGGGPGG